MTIRNAASGDTSSEVTVRVHVLAGKRLILVSPHDAKVKVLQADTSETGVITNFNDVPWLYFPVHDCGLELSKLRDRWDDMIIDAWKQSAEGKEEELFQ